MRGTPLVLDVDVGDKASLFRAPGLSRDRDSRAHDQARRKRKTYPKYLTGTKAGPAIEPVIIPQFVDFDPFATFGRL